MKNVRILVSIVIVLIAFLAINESRTDLKYGLGNIWSQINNEQEQAILKVGNHEIKAYLARSSAELESGLSNFASLDENQGMLFLFGRPDYYGFWMKDMKFAIDIIWLDNDFKVVEVYKNIKPESYPKVFYPKSLAKYVLEIPANMSDFYGLRNGISLKIK